MLAPTNENPPAGRFSRLIRWNYTQAELRADAIAGLTVAAISLPQAMAYALHRRRRSALRPLLGHRRDRHRLDLRFVVAPHQWADQRHLARGTSARWRFSIPRTRPYPEAFLLLGVMVGALQILIAVFQLGDLTRYISESVMLGFMAGAALLLGLGQIGNLLGVRQGDRPSASRHACG